MRADGLTLRAIASALNESNVENVRGDVAFAQAPQPAAKAASKQLTLLITGDNRGEVAPCG